MCHHGTSGGGHYTAYALNPVNEEWYEFDDSFVTKVEPSVVLNAEAYVLFYRKTSVRMDDVRTEIQELLRHQTNTPSLVQHYISRQWINKFENFAEPGPIDNSDFLCRVGWKNLLAHIFNRTKTFSFSSAWRYPAHQSRPRSGLVCRVSQVGLGGVG